MTAVVLGFALVAAGVLALLIICARLSGDDDVTPSDAPTDPPEPPEKHL